MAMAEIEIGDALVSGFELIGRRPLSVMCWGLVRVAFVAAIFAIYAPMLFAIFGQIGGLARPGAVLTPPDMAAFLPMFMAMQGAGFLLQIGGLFVSAVLYCAASRAVLKPEARDFAYMRVGAPELFVVVLAFAAGIVFVVALFACMIPLAFAVAALAVGHQAGAAVLVTLLIATAMIAAIVYIALRFSFVVPMMVDDGAFRLVESWRLTRGHVLSLFLIGLSLVAVLMLAQMIVGAILLAVGFVGLATIAGGLVNLPTFFQQGPATVLGQLTPLLVVYGLAMIPISGCATAIVAAPWARAYRDLVGGAAPPVAAPPAPITAGVAAAVATSARRANRPNFASLSGGT
jgi:hypothetical protein